jgi:hypothetical protein
LTTGKTHRRALDSTLLLISITRPLCGFQRASRAPAGIAGSLLFCFTSVFRLALHFRRNFSFVSRSVSEPVDVSFVERRICVRCSTSRDFCRRLVSGPATKENYTRSFGPCLGGWRHAGGFRGLSHPLPTLHRR